LAVLGDSSMFIWSPGGHKWSRTKGTYFYFGL